MFLLNEHFKIICKKKNKNKCSLRIEIPLHDSKPRDHGVQRRMISLIFFLRFLFFGFIVAICDLVHDMTTIFHLSNVLTASGNLF